MSDGELVTKVTEKMLPNGDKIVHCVTFSKHLVSCKHEKTRIAYGVEFCTKCGCPID